MRILLLNDGYFLPSLRRLGHEVFFASSLPEANLKLGFAPIRMMDILKECPLQPDVILLSDSIDVRPALYGFEKVAIPRVFYGVDSPMNEFWQADFARAFDLVFLDQAAPVRKLRTQFPDDGERFHWLPLGADHTVYRKLELEKKYDVVFVGSIEERLRPKRSALLDVLRKHFNLQVFDGGGKRSLSPEEVVRIFNQSKIVLNENLFPGVNLRTFEAMACGACLLTERSDGSWKILFQEWEHLVAFDSANVVERTRFLLQDDSLRDGIAAKGMALVREKHTIDHRAEQLTKTISECLLAGGRTAPERSRVYYLGRAMLQMAGRWPQQPVGDLKDEGVRLLLSQTKGKCESAPLHFELAAQALEEDRLDDAARSLQRALEIDAAHLRSRWALFCCFRDKGDSKGALREIKRLCHYLHIQDGDRKRFTRIGSGSALLASDYLFLGKVLETAGFLLEPGVDRLSGHPCRWNAFDAYQKAIAMDARSWPAFIRCATLLERCGVPELAVVLVRRAVELRPWDNSLFFKLGEMLLRNYRREEGMQQVLHYLVNSTDSDKWEKVEGLQMTEAEWQSLLDAVWDRCHYSTNAHERSSLASEISKRALRKVTCQEVPVSEP